jgi:peptide/nickel transport system substrate-binding protein
MKGAHFWKLCQIFALIGLMVFPNLVWAQKRGGTLVMIVQPDPPTLASYISTSAPIGMVTAKVYDGLAEYDFNLKPIPSLAESWDISPDGKTVTFKLRKEVKWHDGKPFSSADVKFTVLEVLKKFHPRGASTYGDVTDIETPDPYTAIFRLKNAAPYMMMALSGYESPMLPKHLFEGTDIKNHPNANSPVGPGPFKFVEWKRGQYIRLDRNPDYWKKGQPYLDRIVVRNIPDSATRTAALEKGEAHFAGMGAIYYSDVRQLEKLSNIAVTTKGYEMSSPIVELYFNTAKKPFDNVKVRQAISYAIDRQMVIDNVWFGFGKPATGPMNSNFAASGLYTADVKNYNVPNRLEIANKMLDEAGYPRGANGIRFEIVHDLTPYGEEWRRFGEYVQQVLERLGIKATLRYEDVATWLRRVFTTYDFDLSSNWIQNLADPAIGVHREYHSKSIRPGTVFVNCTRWSSPETDKLMDQAAIEPNPQKRAALYHEFQKRVVEGVPVVWVLELKFSTVTSKDLKDAVVSPLGVFSNFDRAYFEK